MTICDKSKVNSPLSGSKLTNSVTQKRCKPVDYGAIIERHRRLANILSEIGERRRAIAQLEAATAMAVEECGREHQLTGDCQAELGRRLREAGELPLAIEHLREALAAHMVSPGPESEEVAKDYQGLAETYQASDNLEEAVFHYEKALRLRERQLGGNSGDYASLLMGLGGTHSLRGNYGTAVELMRQAVGRFEGARDERLAPALESLGVVYVVSGRTEEAIATLRKARNIWESKDLQEPLHANTQLFETVASYLNPAAAESLLSTLQPVEEEPHTEMKPELRMPAMKKPKRTDVPAEALPEAVPGELETWNSLLPPPAPAVAPAAGMSYQAGPASMGSMPAMGSVAGMGSSPAMGSSPGMGHGPAVGGSHPGHMPPRYAYAVPEGMPGIPAGMHATGSVPAGVMHVGAMPGGGMPAYIPQGAAPAVAGHYAVATGVPGQGHYTASPTFPLGSYDVSYLFPPHGGVIRTREGGAPLDSQLQLALGGPGTLRSLVMPASAIPVSSGEQLAQMTEEPRAFVLTGWDDLAFDYLPANQ